MADKIEDHMLQDLLSRPTDSEMTQEHRDWINEQVRERLARIKAGEAKFVSLDEVRRKFGFDAY